MYLQYVKAVGVTSCVTATLLILLYQACSTAGAVWLSEWTDDPILANTSAHADTGQIVRRNNMYLLVYGLLGLAQSESYIDLCHVNQQNVPTLSNHKKK